MDVLIYKSAPEGMKESLYIPLNVMSEYSIGESIAKIDELIERAKSLNMKALALTDRTLAGALEFYQKCKANDIKPIIGQKIYFASAGLILLCKDFEAYKILCRYSLELMSQIELNEELPFTEEECKHFICITEEYKNSYLQKVFGADLYYLIENIQRITDQIPYIFPEEYFTEYDSYKRLIENLPEFEDGENLLRKLVEEGIQKRKLEKTSELVSRIEFELTDIINRKWTNLFLMHWEITSWCRENNIVYSPGRGTSGGSLVVYLLQITDINPLEYGLLYERFLNSDRITYPDFDIDYDYEHLDDVVCHLKEKYGKNNVARIAVYRRLSARDALIMAGKTLEFPEEEIQSIVSIIPEYRQITIEKLLSGNCFLKKDEDSYSKPDWYIPWWDGVKIKGFLRDKKYEKLINAAKGIEGRIGNKNIHSSGFIITKEPVYNYAPVQIDAKTGELYCEYTFDQINFCGLYKNDILGLRELSKLEKIRKLTGFDYRNIPLDDKETLKAFSKGKTDDVFQFDSPLMQKILKLIKPKKFEDLISLNALYCSGLMDYIPDYIKNKKNPEAIHYPDPCLEDILSETYGVIVYQEQFMQIVQKIAGFSLGEADLLRRAMGKKKPKILLQKKKEFIERAMGRGFSEQQAEDFFGILMISSGAFIKSHAVAYTKMAFWDMYLKVHFNKEYVQIDN